MNKKNISNLVLAGMLTAIGLLLPIVVFHALGQSSGRVFLPMHIPVILCGILCGYKLGGISGAIIPLLSCFMTGMPPVLVAIPMAFELMTYGIVSGLFIKKTNVMLTLIIAMLSGRIVLAVAQAALLGFRGERFILSIFLTEAFATALYGIILQIILIPTVIILLKKSKLY